jgi:hypothetical protein
MIAGALLVFAGLAGLALTRNKEVDTDPVLLPGDILKKRSTAVDQWVSPSNGRTVMQCRIAIELKGEGKMTVPNLDLCTQVT